MRQGFISLQTRFSSHRFFFLLIVGVIVVATILRFYKLAEIPAGFTWDEAAIGYNGSAIWKTRRDEWLVRLPVSFKSFGDFKAPLAIYINGVFTALFGMSIWSVRLPFALSGVIGVILAIAVVREIFSFLPRVGEEVLPKKITLLQLLTLFAGLIVATSPWHLHFSRAGFESGMALSFMLLFLLLSFYSQKSRIVQKPWLFILLTVLAGVSGALATYTYHSAKIAIPLLVVVVFFTSRLEWKKRWEWVAILVLSMLVTAYPLIKDLLYAKGAERLDQTSLFSEYSGIEVPFVIGRNLLTHLSLPFLIGGQTTTLRHGDGTWGVLLISEWFLVIVAVGGMLIWLKKSGSVFKMKELVRVFLFGLGCILSGLLPAAIGVEIPHPNRALLAYPGFLILACLGLYFLLHIIYQQRNITVLLANSSKLKKVFGNTVEKILTHSASLQKYYIFQCILGMTILLHLLFFLSYWHNYLTDYHLQSVEDFQYGYEQAFRFAIDREDQSDKILFTSTYGQPYIYALFFRKTNPIWYQGGSLIKYEFTDRISEADLLRPNTVIVADPTQIDPSKGEELVIAPDGSVKFVLVKNP